MIAKCYMCDEEFLTEADPHAFVFSSGEWKINCGCYFYQAAKAELDRLNTENKALKAQVEADDKELTNRIEKWLSTFDRGDV